ncbi:hypothetical protein CAAN4_H07404 [[Candida] anglica]|uniref:Uncharacterized protein n=1 Tax=[Candida] anglica TaxID=148631 RepID=A0ABP0ENB6_9ASCO
MVRSAIPCSEPIVNTFDGGEGAVGVRGVSSCLWTTSPPSTSYCTGRTVCHHPVAPLLGAGRYPDPRRPRARSRPSLIPRRIAGLRRQYNSQISHKIFLGSLTRSPSSPKLVVGSLVAVPLKLVVGKPPPPPPRQLRRHSPMHRSFEDHGPRTQPRPPCTTHDEWSSCVRPPASSSWEQALSSEVLGLHTRVGGGSFTPRLTNPAKIFFFALKIKLKNSGVTYRTESVFFSAEFLHFYFFFCFRFRFLIYFLRRTAFIPNAKLPTTLKWLH